MTRDEVVAKCHDLMDTFLGAQQSKQLVETILALETVKDVNSLRSVLQRKGHPIPAN
jgi:hypothetical protein